jgi:hypothetical protein
MLTRQATEGNAARFMSPRVEKAFQPILKNECTPTLKCRPPSLKKCESVPNALGRRSMDRLCFLGRNSRQTLKPNLDREGRLGSDEWGSMKVDENKETSPTGVITRAEERPNLKNFEREIAFRHQELKTVPS